MARYRHWENRGDGGDTVFVTTTCLDFCHAFRREEMRTRMARRLLDDHVHYGAVLHAYAVMPHHVHFATTLPAERDVSWLVQRIKTNSAKEMLPLLTAEEMAGFDQQRGLGGRSFWMRSFRGLRVMSDETLHQKIWYTHQNPVRAGYVEAADAYPWSSAAVWQGRRSYDEAMRCVAAECLDRLPTL
ncbi:MAG: transposase [Fimbriimonas sp.]